MGESTPTPNAANTPTTETTTNASQPQAPAQPQSQSQSQSQSQTQPPRPGGAPARVYMNERIVPYLLEGMKGVAKEQPANPLRVLGEYLIQKSNEVEGGGVNGNTNNKSPE